MSSLPNFALNLLTEFSYDAYKNNRKVALIPHKNCIQIVLFSSLGASTFETVLLHHKPLRTVYDILSLKKTLLSSTFLHSLSPRVGLITDEECVLCAVDGRILYAIPTVCYLRVIS